LLDKFELEGKIDEELLKTNKIKSKLKRGYWSNYIKGTLFRSWIKDTKIEIDKEIELENVKMVWDSIKDKYNLKDYKEKQKFITKLVNKGFPFNIINEYIKTLS
jgi:SOS response regulatory protein OraA/RecX